MGYEILQRDRDELDAKASACGIDLSGTFILEPGFYKKPPVISDSYRNRSVYWVTEFQRRNGSYSIRVTFHTLRHGGHTETWVSGHEAQNKVIQSIKIHTRTPEKPYAAQAKVSRVKKSFDRATPAKGSDYLVRKGISEITCKMDIRSSNDNAIFDGYYKNSREFICFELINEMDQFVGLQRIYENGEKMLTPGAFDGSYRGAHAVIGDLDNTPIAYVSEGFATAASIHLCTGFPVVIAISANNLKHVCRTLISKYPHVKFTIAADNDFGSTGNPGLYFAFEAANELRLDVTFPRAKEKMDFNDLHLKKGCQAVLNEIKRIEKIEESEPAFLKQLLPLANDLQKRKITEKIYRLANCSTTFVCTKPPKGGSAGPLENSARNIRATP